MTAGMTADNRFDEKFGQSLKKLRNELGLTQNELAQMMGWTEKHLSHVENGRKLFLLWSLGHSYKIDWKSY